MCKKSTDDRQYEKVGWIVLIKYIHYVNIISVISRLGSTGVGDTQSLKSKC